MKSTLDLLPPELSFISGDFIFLIQIWTNIRPRLQINPAENILINKNVYDRKMKYIFPEPAKFKSISAGTLKVTITREKPLQNFLFSLKEDNVIDEETYERLDPSSSQVFSMAYLRCKRLTFRSDPSFLPLVHTPTTSLNFLFQFSLLS